MYYGLMRRGVSFMAAFALSIAGTGMSYMISVLQAVFDNLDERQRVESRDDGWYADYAGVNIVDEIKGALEYTKDCRDFKDMREAFAPRYNGIGMPYNISYANEVVTKGVCVFKMVNANLKDAIIAASNLGRDTDCIAAIAGGISGALDGTGSLPPEWIEKVDIATQTLRCTNNKRTMREHAEGLFGAYKNRLRKMKETAALMDY
jgi:ADP-ribosylglycohydrolase